MLFKPTVQPFCYSSLNGVRQKAESQSSSLNWWRRGNWGTIKGVVLLKNTRNWDQFWAPNDMAYQQFLSASSVPQGSCLDQLWCRYILSGLQLTDRAVYQSHFKTKRMLKFWGIDCPLKQLGRLSYERRCGHGAWKGAMTLTLVTCKINVEI